MAGGTISSLAVQISANSSEFIEAVDQVKAEANRLNGVNPLVTVGANTSPFIETVAAVKANAESRAVRLKVQADTSQLGGIGDRIEKGAMRGALHAMVMAPLFEVIGIGAHAAGEAISDAFSGKSVLALAKIHSQAQLVAREFNGIGSAASRISMEELDKRRAALKTDPDSSIFHLSDNIKILGQVAVRHPLDAALSMAGFLPESITARDAAETPIAQALAQARAERVAILAEQTRRTDIALPMVRRNEAIYRASPGGLEDDARRGSSNQGIASWAQNPGAAAGEIVKLNDNANNLLATARLTTNEAQRYELLQRMAGESLVAQAASMTTLIGAQQKTSLAGLIGDVKNMGQSIHDAELTAGLSPLQAQLTLLREKRRLEGLSPDLIRAETATLERQVQIAGVRLARERDIEAARAEHTRLQTPLQNFGDGVARLQEMQRVREDQLRLGQLPAFGGAAFGLGLVDMVRNAEHSLNLGGYHPPTADEEGTTAALHTINQANAMNAHQDPQARLEAVLNAMKAQDGNLLNEAKQFRIAMETIAARFAGILGPN